MTRRNYGYVLALISIILVAVMLFVPIIHARYYKSETDNAYHIDFPVMTLAQEKTLASLVSILNPKNPGNPTEEEQQAVEILEDALTNTSHNNTLYLTADDLEGFNDENNSLVSDLVEFGGDSGCIIKFEKNGDGTVNMDTLTMFTQAGDSTVAGNMTTQVFKTILKKNSSGVYEEVSTYEGEAYGTSNPYNTDYWACKLDEGQTFDVDLNLVADGDTSTNYANQYGTYGFFGLSGHFSNYYDGCTFVLFVPEVTGGYTITAKSDTVTSIADVRVKYITGSIDRSTSDFITTNLVNNGNGTWTMNLTAGTKYYFCFQMPAPTAENGITENTNYNVSISVTRNP